jgi:arsenate reductase (glutaredoxin)
MQTLFGIPNCDTVKKSRAWFDANGLAYQFHDFKKQGVPADQLDTWIAALGWEALVNKKGTTWRKLAVAEQAAVTDAASAQALMLREASVIKRPVVVHTDADGTTHTTVGFSPQVWAGWLSS